MLAGTTTTGFKFELDDDVLDDYELLELLSRIDSGEDHLLTTMVEKFLGTEQKERLKEHIRNTNGKVSAKKMFEEITEIFQANSKGKN